MAIFRFAKRSEIPPYRVPLLQVKTEELKHVEATTSGDSVDPAVSSEPVTTGAGSAMAMAWWAVAQNGWALVGRIMNFWGVTIF